MSAAFTPGPWTARPWITSLGGGVYRVISAANRNVSSVSVYGKRSDGTTGGQKLKWGGHAKTVATAECDANAALITAAPDLYAALERAERILREHEYETDYAQAALAKARGDQ